MNSFSSVGLFVSPAIISDTGFSSLHGFLFLANPPTGDPRDADADGDGMTDVWERTMGTRVTVADADDDDDGDGLSNLGEFSEGTNPKNADSDGDGLSDGAEKNIHGSNPLLADSDEDGYTDDAEVAEGSSPMIPIRFHLQRFYRFFLPLRWNLARREIMPREEV